MTILRRVFFWAPLGMLGVFVLFSSRNGSVPDEYVQFPKMKYISCQHFLDSYQVDYSPVIIVDFDFLIASQQPNCTVKSDHRLKIAARSDLIDVFHAGPRWNLIFYKDDNKKGYWTFFDENTRIVPRFSTTNFSNFLIPENISLFIEYWNRSKFINCLNLNMHRKSSKTTLNPRLAVNSLRDIRDYLVSFGMFPIINGGTHLGWYRECGIIPHTGDTDVAVPLEQFNMKLVDELKTEKRKFRLIRQLGFIEDSFELTVIPMKSKAPKIDIFVLYTMGNESYVGGTGGGGAKYQFTYPRLTSVCAGDLLGQLMWVPCNPDEVLRWEYGEYEKDFPSSKFYWNKSGKNGKLVGKIPKSKIKEGIIYFNLDSNFKNSSTISPISTTRKRLSTSRSNKTRS